MDIFFLQKRMDSLQVAFIHPPGAVWGMFYYWFVHFILRVLDCVTETPAMIELRRARTILI